MDSASRRRLTVSSASSSRSSLLASDLTGDGVRNEVSRVEGKTRSSSALESELELSRYEWVRDGVFESEFEKSSRNVALIPTLSRTASMRRQRESKSSESYAGVAVAGEVSERTELVEYCGDEDSDEDWECGEDAGGETGRKLTSGRAPARHAASEDSATWRIAGACNQERSRTVFNARGRREDVDRVDGEGDAKAGVAIAQDEWARCENGE